MAFSIATSRSTAWFQFFRALGIYLRFTLIPWLYYMPLALVIGFVLFAPAPELAPGQSKLELRQTGDIYKQIVLSLSFIIAGVGAYKRRGALPFFIKRNKLLLIFLAYALLSVLWASVPVLALKRWIQFFGFLIVMVCALVGPQSNQRAIAIIRSLFTLAIIVSILQVFRDPTNAIDVLNGGWKGLFGHKNMLGQVAVLCLLLWMPLLARRRDKLIKLLALVFTVLAAFVLVKSDSKTALVNMALVAFIWIIMVFPFRRELKLILAPVPILLLIFWYINLQNLHIGEWINELLQRDSTLSGRTILWGEIMDAFGLHSLIGTGYNSFWTAANDHAVRIVSQIGWDPGQAHNGYLDLLNELGIVGAALFALLLGQALIRTHRFRIVKSDFGTMLFLIVVSQLFYNLTESAFCRGTSLGWFLFLAAVMIASTKEPSASIDTRHSAKAPQ